MTPPRDDDSSQRIRHARQVLAGSEVTPPPDPIDFGQRFAVGGFEFRYFLALSVLVLLSAIVWFIWGTGAATPLLLVLALGLLAGWLIL